MAGNNTKEDSKDNFYTSMLTKFTTFFEINLLQKDIKKNYKDRNFEVDKTFFNELKKDANILVQLKRVTYSESYEDKNTATATEGTNIQANAQEVMCSIILKILSSDFTISECFLEQPSSNSSKLPESKRKIELIKNILSEGFYQNRYNKFLDTLNECESSPQELYAFIQDSILNTTNSNVIVTNAFKNLNDSKTEKFISLLESVFNDDKADIKANLEKYKEINEYYKKLSSLIRLYSDLTPKMQYIKQYLENEGATKITQEINKAKIKLMMIDNEILRYEYVTKNQKKRAKFIQDKESVEKEIVKLTSDKKLAEQKIAELGLAETRTTLDRFSERINERTSKDEVDKVNYWGTENISNSLTNINKYMSEITDYIERCSAICIQSDAKKISGDLEELKQSLCKYQATKTTIKQNKSTEFFIDTINKYITELRNNANPTTNEPTTNEQLKKFKNTVDELTAYLNNYKKSSNHLSYKILRLLEPLLNKLKILKTFLDSIYNTKNYRNISFIAKKIKENSEKYSENPKNKKSDNVKLITL